MLSGKGILIMKKNNHLYKEYIGLKTHSMNLIP